MVRTIVRVVNWSKIGEVRERVTVLQLFYRCMREGALRRERDSGAEEGQRVRESCFPIRMK